jgi:arabinan endo-1,5-alpha-L-arabinosidase
MENCANEWKLVLLTEKQLLMVRLGKEEIKNLIIFAGHDWENETETIYKFFN